MKTKGAIQQVTVYPYHETAMIDPNISLEIPKLSLILGNTTALTFSDIPNSNIIA